MYNNYGFNPYYQPPKYQGMEQVNQPIAQQQYIQPTPTMVTKPIGLLGKSVDSIDVVKAMDIPLDGSVSYFPLTDGSAIVTKQLQTDGTSKTIVYKPIEEDKQKVPKYITQEELENAIEKIDLSEIEDIKDELREIRKQLKIKKSKED